MPQDQSLPDIWLVSDARNDAVLDRALRNLPRASGLIYRHYHLGGPDRLARFRDLKRIARACGHTVILADSALTATEWGADGIYGSPPRTTCTKSGWQTDMVQMQSFYRPFLAHNPTPERVRLAPRGSACSQATPRSP